MPRHRRIQISKPDDWPVRHRRSRGVGYHGDQPIVPVGQHIHQIDQLGVTLVHVPLEGTAGSAATVTAWTLVGMVKAMAKR
jgi:hypothetical protein